MNTLRKNSDSDLSDYKEKKVNPKKSIEDIYLSLVKNLEEISNKQKELEFRIEAIESKNEFYMQENDELNEEVNQKRIYSANLEKVICFIYDVVSKRKNEENSKLGELIKELSNSPNIATWKKNVRKISESLNESNLSSTIESEKNKSFDLLSMKRKRMEESKSKLELFGNLNQKEKDAIFDEITNLTPCMMTSPTMSPTLKKAETMCIFNSLRRSANLFSI